MGYTSSHQFKQHSEHEIISFTVLWNKLIAQISVFFVYSRKVFPFACPESICRSSAHTNPNTKWTYVVILATHVISTQKKGLWYPFNRTLDGFQSWSGSLEKNNLFPLPGIEPWFLRHYWLSCPNSLTVEEVKQIFSATADQRGYLCVSIMRFLS